MLWYNGWGKLTVVTMVTLGIGARRKLMICMEAENVEHLET